MSGGYAGSETDQLELRHYLGVLWRRRIAIVATALAIVAVGGLYAFEQTPLYKSTASVLLAPSVAEVLQNPIDSAQSRGADTTAMQTEIEVMSSQSVRQAVAQALGWPEETPSSRLGDIVSITVVPSTTVVSVTASSTDAEEAARIAQTYAETYVTVRLQQLLDSLLQASDQIQARLDAIRQQLTELDRPVADLDAQIVAAPLDADRERLQAQRDELIRRTDVQRLSLRSREADYAEQLDGLSLARELGGTGSARLVDNAEVSAVPASARPAEILAVALGFGLLVGVAAAFLREHYDDRITGEEDLKRAIPDLPVLGVIPAVRGWRRGRPPVLASMIAPRSPAAQAYRGLRTSLQLAEPHPPTLVQVTSPGPGEGKTATVCNLAVSLARTGRRVVAVDCDLDQPRLHEFFGLGNEVGLTSALLGEVALADAVRRVIGEPQLAVVPRGPTAAEPAELLSSDRFSAILALLSAEADVVLLDGPPVLTGTDAIVLSGLADTVIMVVTLNTTRRGAERGVDLLRQVYAHVIGTVLVKSPRRVRWRPRSQPRREVAVEQDRQIGHVVGVMLPKSTVKVRGEDRLTVPEQASQ